MGAFPWHACTIIVIVLLVVVPTFSQTENEFWQSQKNPLFSGEKVVLDPVPEINSQNDIYMSSASNEGDYDSEYMHENMGEYEVLPSVPHTPENLMITPYSKCTPHRYHSKCSKCSSGSKCTATDDRLTTARRNLTAK
jgi:hypothetical protein